MTAEVSVMNTMGVALAADSAVTIGRGTKIYNSANKLFSLSKYHPIGIMIYGNANFLRTPWETIIKVYRNKLGEKQFNKLSDYAENFIEFLIGNDYEEINSQKILEQSILSMMDSELTELLEEIIEQLKDFVDENPDIEQEKFPSFGNSLIEEKLLELENEEYIEGFTDEDMNQLLNDYGDKLDEMANQTFEKFIFSEDMITNIKYIVLNTLLKRFSNGRSGIVIAGFGDSELFPSLYSYEIEGIINGKLKYAVSNKTKIGESTSASITPFAQSDMVYSFLTGIDQDIEQLSESYLSSIFKHIPRTISEQLTGRLKEEENLHEIENALETAFENVFNEYLEVISDYKEKNFLNPILSIVHSLPKEELAEMAEALVNLTSFKRKVSSSIESVGGPIDVAVITKGDGFIWIKRKHYFDEEKNRQFSQKYYWRDTHGANNS